LDAVRQNRVRDRSQEPQAERAAHPLTAEGRPTLNPDKLSVMLHSDQIEISPDGKWLYSTFVIMRPRRHAVLRTIAVFRRSAAQST
jgi:hypothetical protein